MRYLKWLMARLAGHWAGHVVIAIALVLALPALFSPLVMDDHLHTIKWREAIEHHKGIAHFLNDCFIIAGGDSTAKQQAFEHGNGAWWTAPDFKHAFWRPLSAATHAIDQSLWPGNAVLMHVHTLLWFLGLLLAMSALYRRSLTPRVASLALALYAWDDAHGMVLSWVANRSAFIAGLFGILVIWAHDKWRQDGWRPGAWLGPLLLALGLFSAEMAIATAGFLFAHALCLDKGSLGRRMARLAPYVLVVVAWQAVYGASGYGAEASGWYLHPLHEPLSYAAKLLERAPILSLAQLTPIPSDTWGLYPPLVKVAVFLLAVAVLVVVARVAWPRLAAKPEACFWLIGAGFSLLPVSATTPNDRNLVFVGFGVAPGLAILFASSVDSPHSSRWPRFVVAALVLFNLVLAPLALPAKCLSTLGMNYTLARTNLSIPRDSTVAQKTLVVVWLMSDSSLGVSWWQRDAQGIPKPGKTRVLATGLGDVVVTRLDEVTLRLCPDDGFFPSEFHQISRGPSRPFHDGDVVKFSDMTATVTEITGGWRPKTVEFHFTTPLDSTEWLWMRGEGVRLVNWTPPRVGETIVVKAEF